MLADIQVKDNMDKIRWSCRRGMLELDKLLIPFFDKCYNGLSEIKKDKFIELLSFDDPVLFDWFFKDDLPDDSQLQDLIMVMRYMYNQQCSLS